MSKEVIAIKDEIKKLWRVLKCILGFHEKTKIIDKGYVIYEYCNQCTWRK